MKELLRLNLVLLLVLTGLFWHSAGRADSMLVSWISEEVTAQLEVKVQVIERRPLPELRWPATATLSLRYPAGTGQHLPCALEAWQSGRLLGSLPLGSYLDFRLKAVNMRSSLPRGSQLDLADLQLSEQTLAPGQEVVTDPALASGLVARGFLPAGERLRLSRLTAPPAVCVGCEVPLLLRTAGIEVSALGTALADAYVGQPLSVRRLSDGRVCRGVVRELETGVVVVVVE